MIRITVPATSANLGVGYDVLGMAVTLYAHFDFEKSDSLHISGCDPQWQNETNLVYIAFQKTLQLLNKDPFEIALHMSTDIPVSRGLGSSSACVVAGVMAAVHLSNTTATKQEIVDIATHIEGHPDNVAPAILGNVTCSFAEDVPSYSNELAHNITIQSTVHPSLHFVAFIPPYEVSTALARTAVPQEIPLQNAIWNMGRMHALIHALEQGDASLLKASCVDTLHEPYRKNLIPDYHNIASLCADFDTTFWISGSGSTCMAAVNNKTAAQQLIQAAQDAFPNMTLHMLQADTRGAFITNI